MKDNANNFLQPTFAHFGLAALQRHGMVQHWVQVTNLQKEEVAERKHWVQSCLTSVDLLEQLGHDGLAAEAGFPPDDNVEVYDAWYGLPQVPHWPDMSILWFLGTLQEGHGHC